MNKIDRKGWLIGWWLHQENTHNNNNNKKKYILKRERREIPRKVGAHRYIYSPPAVLKVFYFFILLLFIIYPPISLIVYVFRFLFQFKSLQLLSTFQFSHRFLFFCVSADGEERASWRSLPTVADRRTSGIPNNQSSCFVFFSIHFSPSRSFSTPNSDAKFTVPCDCCSCRVYIQSPSWLKEFILSQYNPKREMNTRRAIPRNNICRVIIVGNLSGKIGLYSCHKKVYQSHHRVVN